MKKWASNKRKLSEMVVGTTKDAVEAAARRDLHANLGHSPVFPATKVVSHVSKTSANPGETGGSHGYYKTASIPVGNSSDGLGRPCSPVDAMFDRARVLAKKFDSSPQSAPSALCRLAKKSACDSIKAPPKEETEFLLVMIADDVEPDRSVFLFVSGNTHLLMANLKWATTENNTINGVVLGRVASEHRQVRFVPKKMMEKYGAETDPSTPMVRQFAKRMGTQPTWILFAPDTPEELGDDAGVTLEQFAENFRLAGERSHTRDGCLNFSVKVTKLYVDAEVLAFATKMYVSPDPTFVRTK